MTKEEIIDLHLNNEKILWQGCPQKTPLFNKTDILLIPFSTILGGFLIFYAVILAQLMVKGQGILFSFVGITMLLIGLYLLLFRFWYRKKRISRQLYFITDKRVFAFDTMRDEVIFDITLEDTLLCCDKNNIILGQTNPIGDFVYNLGLDIFFRNLVSETPSFKYLENGDEVFKIITKIKEKDTYDDSLFI